MPPAPCPERLRTLIERVNREGGDEAHVLKLILAEVEKRRQGKGQETYVAKLQSTITINLTDYTSHIRNELADALADIDPPDRIERIRYCPVCNCLFWAGTSRKKACDKHGDRVRKANNRRDIKRRQVSADVQRRREEATKTFDAMKKTAQAVIRAIMDRGADTFGAIDAIVWNWSYDDGEVPRPILTVRRVTHKLYKDGYLEYHESADLRDERGFSRLDRYTPTQKLIDLWNDSQPRR